MTFRLSHLVVACGLTAGAASASETVEFRCTALGDGAYSVYISPETPDTAIAVYVLSGGLGGRSGDIVLDRTVTASGFGYTGEGLEFRGKGDVATLTDNDLESTCVVYEASGEDGTGEATQNAAGSPLPAAAMALGGNIRSGPGTENARVGSISQGAPITLEENTGVMLDGYPWFFIREENGDTGYVWGGIICAPQGGVTGVYESCS